MSNMKNMLLEQTEKDPWKEVFDLTIQDNYVKSQVKDNLFSANHRNAMLEQYGFTQAQTLTIKDLI